MVSLKKRIPSSSSRTICSRPRIADRTAFFLRRWEITEAGDTMQIFQKPADKRNGGLHHRPLRLMIRGRERSGDVSKGERNT